MLGDLFDDGHEDEPFEFFAEVAVDYDVLVRLLALCDSPPSGKGYVVLTSICWTRKTAMNDTNVTPMATASRDSVRVSLATGLSL
jgi:hypothetical protein